MPKPSDSQLTAYANQLSGSKGDGVVTLEDVKSLYENPELLYKIDSVLFKRIIDNNKALLLSKDFIHLRKPFLDYAGSCAFEINRKLAYQIETINPEEFIASKNARYVIDMLGRYIAEESRIAKPAVIPHDEISEGKIRDWLNTYEDKLSAGYEPKSEELALLNDISMKCRLMMNKNIISINVYNSLKVQVDRLLTQAKNNLLQPNTQTNKEDCSAGNSVVTICPLVPTPLMKAKIKIHDNGLLASADEITVAMEIFRSNYGLGRIAKKNWANYKRNNEALASLAPPAVRFLKIEDPNGSLKDLSGESHEDGKKYKYYAEPHARVGKAHLVKSIISKIYRRGSSPYIKYKKLKMRDYEKLLLRSLKG